MKRDWFDYFTILMAVSALVVSLYGMYHTSSIEQKTDHRVCIGDLSSFPSILRDSGQQTTDSIFRWVVTPSVSNRKVAKRDVSSLLTQIQTLQGTLSKYNCNIEGVTKAVASIKEIFDSIKNSDLKNIDFAVDNYSESWDAFVDEPPLSSKCCN